MSYSILFTVQSFDMHFVKYIKLGYENLEMHRRWFLSLRNLQLSETNSTCVSKQLTCNLTEAKNVALHRPLRISPPPLGDFPENGTCKLMFKEERGVFQLDKGEKEHFNTVFKRACGRNRLASGYTILMIINI